MFSNLINFINCIITFQILKCKHNVSFLENYLHYRKIALHVKQTTTKCMTVCVCVCVLSVSKYFSSDFHLLLIKIREKYGNRIFIQKKNTYNLHLKRKKEEKRLKNK